MWDPCPQYDPAEWRHPSWIQGLECLYGKTCLKIEDTDQRILDIVNEPESDPEWYYAGPSTYDSAYWSTRIQYPEVFTTIGDYDNPLDWECADIAGNGGDVIQIKWWQKSNDIAINNNKAGYIGLKMRESETHSWKEPFIIDPAESWDADYYIYRGWFNPRGSRAGLDNSTGIPFYTPGVDFGAYYVTPDTSGAPDSTTSFTKNYFVNSQAQLWEEFSFTFKIHPDWCYEGELKSNREPHDYQIQLFVGSHDLEDITTLPFADYGQPQEEISVEGTLWYDSFTVRKIENFHPDADIRAYKHDVTSPYSLFQYHDKNLPVQFYDDNILINGEEAYDDTKAPIEVQFYFYPRTYRDDPFIEKDVLLEYSNGNYYLTNIDWGDGSPKEYIQDAFQLGYDKILRHHYESSGPKEVTGYMVLVRKDDSGGILGVIHNKFFRAKFFITPGNDNDFKEMKGTGFSFLPSTQDTPVVGGISKKSIYYKSTSRRLGYLSDGSKVDVFFETQNDRLKAEQALASMDENRVGETLRNYMYPIYSGEVDEDGQLIGDDLDNDGIPDDAQLIHTGYSSYKNLEELGKYPGELDIGQVRYMSEPLQMYEMLGFEEPNIDDYTPELGENLYVGNAFLACSDCDFDSIVNFDGGVTLQSPTPSELHSMVGSDLSINVDHTKTYRVQATLNISALSGGNVRVYLGSGGGGYTEGQGANSEFSEIGVDHHIDTLITTDNYIDAFEHCGSDGDGEIGHHCYTLEISTASTPQSTAATWTLSNISVREVLNTESIEYDTTEEATTSYQLNHPGNPSSPRYWKNIIPEDYTLYDREGITIEENNIEVDTSIPQNWVGTNEYGNDYYYPVLPKLNELGGFTNNLDGKIPFGSPGRSWDEEDTEAAITNKNVQRLVSASVLIDTEFIKELPHLLSDFSGNDLYPFTISDYRVDFDVKTGNVPMKDRRGAVKLGRKGGSY